MADEKQTQTQAAAEPKAAERPPDPGPGRTPYLGLTYTNDSAMNANLDKLDTAIGALQPAPAK